MLKKLSLFNFEKVLLYLILSFPILLITGPFLPDLTVVMVSIYFCLNYYKFKINNLIIFLFTFYFVLQLTTFFSFDIFYSLKKTVPYVRFILFLIVFSYLFEKYKNYHKYFYLSIFFGILYLVFTSGIIYVYEYISFEAFPNRLGLIHRDEKILGSITIRLIPLLFIGIYFFSKNYNSLIFKIIYVLLIFGAYFLVIASGERSSILLLILFNFLYFIFIDDVFIKKIFLKSLGSIILFYVLLQFIIGIKTLNRYDIFYDAIEKKSISYLAHAHTNHFSTAFKMFKKKPLTGYGNGSFFFKCNEKEYYSGKNSCSTHPHNIYLELLSEHGLFSFLIILSLFFYAVFKITYIKVKKIYFENSEPLKLVLINIIINFWPLISTGSFFNNYMSCYFFLPLALLSYYGFSKTKT